MARRFNAVIVQWNGESGLAVAEIANAVHFLAVDRMGITPTPHESVDMVGQILSVDTYCPNQDLNGPLMKIFSCRQSGYQVTYNLDVTDRSLIGYNFAIRVDFDNPTDMQLFKLVESIVDLGMLVPVCENDLRNLQQVAQAGGEWGNIGKTYFFLTTGRFDHYTLNSILGDSAKVEIVF